MRIEFLKKGVEGNKFRYQVMSDGKTLGKMNVNINLTYKNLCILSADQKVVESQVLTTFARGCKGMTVYIKLHPLEVQGNLAKILAEVSEDELYKTVWTRSSSAQKIYKIQI